MKMASVNSIKFKSNAFVLVLILLTIGTLSGLFLTAIKHYQEEQLEAYLGTQARTANVMLSQGLNDESIRAVLRQMTADASMRAALYNEKGVLLRESSFLSIGQPESESSFEIEAQKNTALKEAVKGKIAYRKLTAEATKGDALIDYYAPLYKDDIQIGILRLTYRYQSYLIFYRQMLNQTLVTSLIVFAISGMAGLWYFGKQATRLERLKVSVEAVAQTRGELNSEIEELSIRRDEYGVLAQSVADMGRTINHQFESLEEEQSNLMQAVNRLREMEAKQRQFFGNITHEFKTPLSVINACNDLTALYSEDRELLENNQRQIKIEVLKLNRMVENALELAKTEQYDFEVQWEVLDFKALCTEAMNRLKVKASKYGIEISLEAKEEASFVRGDRQAISQIMINLMDNAIKYNKKEGRIFLKLEKRQTTKAFWQFSVTDEGQGMSAEQVECLFQPYGSVKSSNLTEVSGSGLGLALAHKLANVLNGELYLEKTDERGSTFVLNLPVAEKP